MSKQSTVKSGSVGSGGASEPQFVPAACIVDADVVVDFAPSCESEGAAERAAAAAAAAAEAQAAQAAAAAAAAMAKVRARKELYETSRE